MTDREISVSETEDPPPPWNHKRLQAQFLYSICLYSEQICPQKIRRIILTH